MISPSTSFSSKLRLSKKLDYGFGVVLFLITTASFIWVTGRYILTSGVDPKEITALMIFLFCTIISLFFLLWCLLYILRSRITIDNNGVAYQGPFLRTILSWEHIEGFAFTGKSLYLVYHSSKIPNGPTWIEWFIKSKPQILLSQFTNEFPQSGSTIGPLMSTIFNYAPHLFIIEEDGECDFLGVQQDAK